MLKRELNLQEIIESLSDIYNLLNEEQKREFKANIKICHYKKNDIIYHEGDKPDCLMCLVHGRVKTCRNGVGGRSQTIRLFKPVDFFGYRAYITGEEFVTRAVAFEQCTIAQIPLKFIERLLHQNNELCFYFVHHLAKALGKSDERVVNLTQKHIRGRLAEALLYLMENYGLEEDGITLPIQLSREELANLSNMTTSNAIRTLSAFAHEGLVTTVGKRIKLENIPQLQKISRLG